MQIGYGLVRLSDSAVLSRYPPGQDLYNLVLDGQGMWRTLSWRSDDHALVDRVAVNDQPVDAIIVSESESFDGVQINVTRTFAPVPRHRHSDVSTDAYPGYLGARSDTGRKTLRFGH